MIARRRLCPAGARSMPPTISLHFRFTRLAALPTKSSLNDSSGSLAATNLYFTNSADSNQPEVPNFTLSHAPQLHGRPRMPRENRSRARILSLLRPMPVHLGMALGSPSRPLRASRRDFAWPGRHFADFLPPLHQTQALGTMQFPRPYVPERPPR